jgi:hypothetical protein
MGPLLLTAILPVPNGGEEPPRPVAKKLASIRTLPRATTRLRLSSKDCPFQRATRRGPFACCWSAGRTSTAATGRADSEFHGMTPLIMNATQKEDRWHPPPPDRLSEIRFRGRIFAAEAIRDEVLSEADSLFSAQKTPGAASFSGPSIDEGCQRVPRSRPVDKLCSVDKLVAIFLGVHRPDALWCKRAEHLAPPGAETALPGGPSPPCQSSSRPS